MGYWEHYYPGFIATSVGEITTVLHREQGNGKIIYKFHTHGENSCGKCGEIQYNVGDECSCGNIDESEFFSATEEEFDSIVEKENV